MASIVVLVRHGKAQSRDTDVEDFVRTLTEPGRRSLAATLPDALAPLADIPAYRNGTTEIWSSAAYRSMETAEEVGRVLGISKIDRRKSLFEQHFNVFIKEAQEAEADVIVAVGHNPFMDQAAAKLCGVAVPFKTGAVGIFDISGYDGAPDDATLRYFAQGPRIERWKTLVKIEGILAKSADNVEANLERYLQAPEDADAVHDFRVSIRTLRSQLAFIEPFQKADQNRRMQLGLRDLVLQTSRLRELDVLREAAAASAYANDEVDALCAKMRRRENDKLVKSVGGKKARKDLRRFLGKFRAVQWKDNVERHGLGTDDIAARFDAMVLEFDAKYLAADYRKVKATHKLRKEAKLIRYASRDFGELIGAAAAGMPQAMQDVQDELGALCDARVNCDILDSMPRKKLSEEADEAVAGMKQEQLDLIEAILLSSELTDDELAALAAEPEAEPQDAAAPADEATADEATAAAEMDMPENIVDSAPATAPTAPAAPAGSISAPADEINIDRPEFGNFAK